MSEQYIVECTDKNISDELKAELGFVYDEWEEAEEDARELSEKYPDNFFGVRQHQGA